MLTEAEAASMPQRGINLHTKGHSDITRGDHGGGKGEDMHTHAQTVLPLGPRVVPLSGPRVVVDKVNSAIVLTLLCRRRRQPKKRSNRRFESKLMSLQFILTEMGDRTVINFGLDLLYLWPRREKREREKKITPARQKLTVLV